MQYVPIWGGSYRCIESVSALHTSVGVSSVVSVEMVGFVLICEFKELEVRMKGNKEFKGI